MIKIDFENTYDPVDVAEDLSFMTFLSINRNLDEVLIKIEIMPLGDPLLPNVYNLAFGPASPQKTIDDKARINHMNRDKMFSTVLLFCLAFLQSNSDVTIGLDGSNDGRAYLYHRMFQTNKHYLTEFFIAVGVDWYVRLLRNGTVEKDADGLPFFKPKPELFDYARVSNDLYRYYMFHLKNDWLS